LTDRFQGDNASTFTVSKINKPLKPTTMASKKQHEVFNKKVEQFLKSIGAVDNGRTTGYLRDYKWLLNTDEFGRVVFTVHEPSKNPVFSVYAQFVDYDQYKEKIRTINDHWKWNIHQMEADFALQMLKFNISKVKEQIPF
jgi:hypothetical protein